MILLDTNVISEMMKPEPQQEVSDWLDQQDPKQLYISSVSVAEISYGIQSLPEGKRKKFLKEGFEKLVQSIFHFQILFFDTNAACFYGEIMATLKLLGNPMSILDGQIASITFAQKALLATRNTKDFEHCNIETFNPFQKDQPC